MSRSCSCPGPEARLVLAISGSDGGVHTRSWRVCGGSAADLAAGLGGPDSESIASAEAIARIREGLAGIPGIVRTST